MIPGYGPAISAGLGMIPTSQWGSLHSSSCSFKMSSYYGGTYFFCYLSFCIVYKFSYLRLNVSSSFYYFNTFSAANISYF